MWRKPPSVLQSQHSYRHCETPLPPFYVRSADSQEEEVESFGPFVFTFNLFCVVLHTFHINIIFRHFLILFLDILFLVFHKRTVACKRLGSPGLKCLLFWKLRQVQEDMISKNHSNGRKLNLEHSFTICIWAISVYYFRFSSISEWTCDKQHPANEWESPESLALG